MEPDEVSSPRSFEQLSRQQLVIYARELQELFNEERHLRQELEGQKSQLEQLFREMAALNRLFQEHLSQRFKVVQAYREVLEGVQKIAQEINALAEHAKSQSLPPQDLPDPH